MLLFESAVQDSSYSVCLSSPPLPVFLPPTTARQHPVPTALDFFLEGEKLGGAMDTLLSQHSYIKFFNVSIEALWTMFAPVNQEATFSEVTFGKKGGTKFNNY